MIGTLLRRDFAVLQAPVVIASGAVMGGLFGHVGNEDVALGYGPETIGDERSFLQWILLILLMSLFIYFAGFRMWERTTRMHMALPIPARTMLLARVTAMTVPMIGTGVLACIAFAALYRHPIDTRVQAIPVFNALALVALLPILYHSSRTWRRSFGMPLPLYLPMVAAIGWLAEASDLRTPWPGIVALSLAVVLGAATYRRMPASYELVAPRPPGAGALAPVSERWSGFLEETPLLRTWARFDRLVRPEETFSKQQIVGILGICLVANLLVATASPEPVLLAVIALQFFWFVRVVNGIVRIAHLPIDRAAAFRYAAWPGIACGLVLVAVPVRVHLGPEWPSVLSSKPAGIAALLCVLVWFVMLSTPLVAAATPPRTRRGWWLRYPCRARYWVAVAVAAVVAHAAVLKVTTGDWASRPLIVELIAEWVPVSAAELWGLAVVLAAVGYVLLRRDFLRAEPATLGGGFE